MTRDRPPHRLFNNNLSCRPFSVNHTHHAFGASCRWGHFSAWEGGGGSRPSSCVAFDRRVYEAAIVSRRMVFKSLDERYAFFLGSVVQ